MSTTPPVVYQPDLSAHVAGTDIIEAIVEGRRPDVIEADYMLKPFVHLGTSACTLD